MLTSLGKYSPTVNHAYYKDESWFENNCLEEFAEFDKDGFDSFGYNKDGLDRANHYENDYNCTEVYDDVDASWLYIDNIVQETSKTK